MISTIETTYNQVLNLFTYRYDSEQFPGVPDDWRSYADDVELGIPFQDDCDGFALTVAELLIRRSVPADSVSLAICETETSTGHLVCMVDGLLLDYRRPLFLAWDKANYTWYGYMKMSTPGVWKYITAVENVPVSGVTRNYLSITIPSNISIPNIVTDNDDELLISTDSGITGISLSSLTEEIWWNNPITDVYEIIGSSEPLDLLWGCFGISGNKQVLVVGTQLKQIPYSGSLYKSIDSGAHWIEQHGFSVTPSWQYSNVSINYTGSIILVGDGEDLFRYSNSVWSKIYPGNTVGNNIWKGAVSYSGRTMLAGIDRVAGKLWKSINYGVTWVEVLPIDASDRYWTSCNINSNGSVLVVGISQYTIGTGYSNVQIFKSTDSGVTWGEQIICGEPIGTGLIVYTGSDGLWSDRETVVPIEETINDTLDITSTIILWADKYFEYLVNEYLNLDSDANSQLHLLVTDFLTSIDSQLVKWNGTKTLTDTFSIYEDIKLQFIKTINEALTLTDSPSAMLELLLSEFILFAESIKANWNTTRTVNDGVTLTDSIVQALQLFITESLVLTDAQVVQLQLVLSEFVQLSESVIPNWNTTRIVTDTFDVKDFLYQQLNLILTEALTVTDSTPLCQLGLAIYEYLGFTELLSAPGSFTQGVTDSLDAADSLNFGYSQVINDVFSLVDVADTVRLLLNTVSESLGLSETLMGSLRSTLPVTESLVLADTVASQGRLYNTVYDTLFLNVTVEMDGETWECYVLNTPKFLPSIYTGFNFNSYAVFQNRAYGCKSDGIYELTGDTDNGVVFHTGVQLSETKFGLPNQKRFRKAYIGVSGATPLLTMETEAGETKTYSIDSDGEVDASRVLRSKKWKLTLTDFDQLDFIKLVPVVLAK